MNYREQLLSKEWQNKRNEILSRDNYICQTCLNIQIIQNSTKHNALIVNHRYLLCITMGWENSEFYQFLLHDESKQTSKWAHGFLNVKNDFIITQNDIVLELTNSKGNPLFTEPENSDNINNDKIVITGILDPQGKYWKRVNCLHVHHTYYQTNKLAWEYPSSALQTLCSFCHYRLHAKENVKVYDENMIEIGLYTNCQRCIGLGYLPQFRHVQNGVCFKCNGLKYLELI